MQLFILKPMSLLQVTLHHIIHCFTVLWPASYRITINKGLEKKRLFEKLRNMFILPRRVIKRANVNIQMYERSFYREGGHKVEVYV